MEIKYTNIFNESKKIYKYIFLQLDRSLVETPTSHFSS